MIFEIAAERCGAMLAGGWMVGDHPSYDIAGGVAAGLQTVLVGYEHPEVGGPVPTHHVSSVLEVFPMISAG